MNFSEKSISLHRELAGKWEMRSKVPLNDRNDLSLAYTPGVAAVCQLIAENKSEAYNLTMKANSVAIVSDGTAVLGLGDIGPEAGLPVMEGKAILFKEFANIDGVPIVLASKEKEDIINAVKMIAPTFGGINLEDIAAPKAFEIENALQDIGIPVFHDDQHGTAIVLLAALINACKVTGKNIEDLTVVINGAGAAGIAIAKLLRCVGHHPDKCTPVKDIYICDTQGIVSPDRTDLNPFKVEMLKYSNMRGISGSFRDALKGADVFIGVSKGNLLTSEDIRTMAKDPIIFAMANPIPEIMPDDAYAAGAAVVGTGRSDFPNQVNNVLAFPGIFRGAIDAGAVRITEGMKIKAAFAIAGMIENPNSMNILPDALNKETAKVVAEAVRLEALAEGVIRK